jgi:hypothetical protein
MANNAEGFKAPQCEKQAGLWEHGCPKNSLQQESIWVELHHTRFSATLIRVCAQQPPMHFCILATRTPRPRTRQILRACGAFRGAGRFGLADGEQPSMSCANDAYEHSRSNTQSVGGATQDLLVTCERCTIVSR